MRATDANTLEELEMHYGDRDRFASLHDWFGDTENYWNKLKRLLMVADYTKKRNPSAGKKITALSKMVVELFHKTKYYASGWTSKDTQLSNPSKFIPKLQTKVGIT